MAIFKSHPNLTLYGFYINAVGRTADVSSSYSKEPHLYIQTGFTDSSCFTFTSLCSISCLFNISKMGVERRGWDLQLRIKKNENARNCSRMGRDWEKVTHQAVMFSAGRNYSAGSESV